MTETEPAYTSTRLTPAARRRKRLVRAIRRSSRDTRRRLNRAVGGLAGTVAPLGWATIAVCALALALGYGMGWVEFATIGLALGALIIGSALHLVGRVHYDVTLEVVQTRTTVGSAVAAKVALSEGRRPLWGGRLEVQIGDQALQLRMEGRGADAATKEFPVPADRRGIVTVGPVRTVRGDPIGLFRRDVEWTSTVQVHVHPEVVAVPSTSTGFIRDLEGSPTRDLTASDISFHALREYRPGDERRHIHWKATARTGELTVRQFEETRRSHVVVAFGLARVDYVGEDEFELAVSAATSIAARAIRDGRDVSIVTSPPRSGAGEEPTRLPTFLPALSRERLLDAASELEFGSADAGIGTLSRLAAGAVEGISLVFLVVGTAPSVRDLRSWSLRFPAGVEIAVIVCGPGRLPTLRRVAELSVVTIGYLDDLRRSLSRMAA